MSRSQFVFVRVGERVDRALWYVAPISRYTVSEQFSIRRREMGLHPDAVLHSTRHTFLTDLAAAGADAFTIKKLAGHASVTTSEEYIHPVGGTVIRAMKELERTRKRDAQAQRPKLRAVGRGTKRGTI